MGFWVGIVNSGNNCDKRKNINKCSTMYVLLFLTFFWSIKLWDNERSTFSTCLPSHSLPFTFTLFLIHSFIFYFFFSFYIFILYIFAFLLYVLWSISYYLTFFDQTSKCTTEKGTVTCLDCHSNYLLPRIPSPLSPPIFSFFFFFFEVYSCVFNNFNIFIG